MLKVLAADIGGTNSRFARFDLGERSDAHIIGECSLASKSFASFAALLQELRQNEFWKLAEGVECFVIAITGPVQGGKYCQSVNLPWDVDLERDQHALPKCPAWLINDFLAQAFATLSPVAAEAEVVLPGVVQSGTLVSVIGAGTGLGKAFLVPSHSGQYLGCPSEGGHATFACESEEDVQMMRFACKKIPAQYIDWEDLLSGRGLQLIHEYFSGERLEASEIAQRSSEFSKTIEYLARTYGRACRDFALTTLPTGGLYIAGGVAAKNPHIVFSTAFREAFLGSKSYREVLEAIPVRLFDNERSGLWGAAWYGRERTRDGGKHGG